MRVVTHFRISKEDEADFVAAAPLVIEEGRKDSACVSYELHKNLTPGSNHTEYTLIEEWSSPAALQAHSQTPHVAMFSAAVKGWSVARPSVGKYARVF